MGYFSSIASGEGTVDRQDGFEAFALDPNAIDGIAETAESPAPLTEQFEDEERQEAEAAAAPAVLAMLNKQADGDEDAGAVPEQAAKTQPTEDQKKKEFEEAEAKRRAEWEARQAAKKAAEDKALQELAAMSDDELAAASVKRMGDQSEAITRQNMMTCVTEYIQTLCYEDMAFARLTMQPKKSMVNCFKYINQKAYERAKEEMEVRGIQATQQNPYASAVTEDLCYQWAEAYFRDPDAKEDKSEEEEFVPKTYYGGGSKAKKTAAKPKVEKKKKTPVEIPKEEDGDQLSLLEAVPA